MAATKASSTASTKTASPKTASTKTATTKKAAATRAAKPKAAPKPAAAPADGATGAAAPVVEAAATEKAGTVKVALKLRPLVDRVITATGAKKKGVKEIVEATLAEIGAALSRGEDLNLPPLGKARVNRQNERNGGEVLVVKLNRPGAKTAGGKPEKEGLAEGGEEG